jgi:hypothetical protein
MLLLVGGLQETVGTHVVDGVMEDIRLGMEVNLPKYSQRRVAMIKYLGELYNYRMVESSDIFKVITDCFPCPLEVSSVDIFCGVCVCHEHFKYSD